MRIEVTQEDIERGEKGSCYKCPIANAMRRAGLKCVRVEDMLTWDTGEDWYMADVPPSVNEFIEAFDEGRDVAPFTFEIKPEIR